MGLATLATHPAHRPQGWRRGIAVGLPLALPLLWALLLFVLIPQITYPLAVLCINLPDFGYTALVSGALAVLWCLMWAGLNWVGWRRHAVSATPSERAATVNA